MTQSEIDLIFNLTICIYEDPWFKQKNVTREKVQAWVTKQLGDYKIYTNPCGMSWGVLSSKERMEEFLKRMNLDE